MTAVAGDGRCRFWAEVTSGDGDIIELDTTKEPPRRPTRRFGEEDRRAFVGLVQHARIITIFFILVPDRHAPKARAREHGNLGFLAKTAGRTEIEHLDDSFLCAGQTCVADVRDPDEVQVSAMARRPTDGPQNSQWPGRTRKTQPRSTSVPVAPSSLADQFVPSVSSEGQLEALDRCCSG